MTAIPHDVMAAAWPIALDIVSQSQAVEAAQFAIARAIYAERERCAAVALNAPHFTARTAEDVNWAGVVTRRTSRDDIARAIKGA